MLVNIFRVKHLGFCSQQFYVSLIELNCGAFSWLEGPVKW